jgi:nucleoside-diphosphate-sugar epimerase
MKKILITGGAGYVGSALTDFLIKNGYFVSVYDLFIYGKNVFKEKNNLNLIKGDIRDQKFFENSVVGHDAVIHLACISNDPSFEMNPNLGKSINFDAFEPMVSSCKKVGVKRFIYASSSSVYGIKSENNVSEDMSLEPLTDYSKFKAQCEEILNSYKSDDFEVVTIRPATVCGYSKRQRLDVIVNILTNLAFHKREITVFGGDQLRPNLHIQDYCDLVEMLVGEKDEKIKNEIFNVGYQNLSINKISEIVKKVVQDEFSEKKKY